MTLVSKKFYIGIGAIAVLGLYFSSLHSYLLFHNLVEIITISIAFTLFSITWNTRTYMASNYLRLLGIGYAFIALIDLIHTLAYKGMNVFPGYGANLPTQLWIAARYFQAATLMVAPLFVERRISNPVIFIGYSVVVSTVVAIIFSGNFPNCYIDGKGLTSFKIDSEYVITILLLVSFFLFFRKREHFNNRVFILIASSIVCTVISEMSFTTYISVYGFANMVGHFAKLAAFYFIYQAILVTGLREPFDLIFRDLKLAEEALQRSNDTLEEKVRERTVELEESLAKRKLVEEAIRKQELKFRSLAENSPDNIMRYDIDCHMIYANSQPETSVGYDESDFMGKTPLKSHPNGFYEGGSEEVANYQAALQSVLSGDGNADVEMHIPDGYGRFRTHAVRIAAEFDAEGNIVGALAFGRDITVRKHAEEELQRLNRELRAISNCNQILVRAEDEQYLLKEICRIICDEAGYLLAWVGYAENDEAKSVRPVAWGGFDNEYVANTKLSWADDVERGLGPGGTAIRTGKIAYIQDIATDPRMVPWRKLALQRGYRSIIGLPLKDESTNVFGVLLIYSSEINAFTLDELRLLEELAGDLAFGIVVLRIRAENKQAEERIKNKSEELEAANEELTASNEKLEVINEELIATNIELQKTKETLKTSESILKKAQQMAQVGNWEFDVSTGKVLGSDEFFRIYGLTPSPENETNIDEVAACIPDSARIRPALMNLINHGTPYNFEIVINPANGEAARVIHSIANRILDGKGAPICAIGVIQDITERKQAEEEIRKLNQELEQRVSQRTNQLELANKELESFAYSVSHDLRAPLRGIDGFSQALLEDYHNKIDEQGKNYLQRIRLATQRMSQLIDDMLNLSRISRGEINIRQINLSKMVKEITNNLRETQPERQVEFIIQQGINVQADGHLLRIVLENLLGNAWKFTSNHPTARIEFGMQQEKDKQVYFIRDNGAGFDMNYAQKLFNAFQRLHSSTEFPGTGIGLATVQRIIHRHGGKIWAEGEIEKGATFYFTIT